MQQSPAQLGAPHCWSALEVLMCLWTHAEHLSLLQKNYNSCIVLYPVKTYELGALCIFTTNNKITTITHKKTSTVNDKCIHQHSNISQPTTHNMMTQRHPYTHTHLLTPTHWDTYKHVHDENKHTLNTAPPPLPPTQTAQERAASHLSHMQSCLPLVLILESQVKAAWKRYILRLDLKDVIDVENRRVLKQFHTQLTRHLILERCLIHIYWNPNGHNVAA